MRQPVDLPRAYRLLNHGPTVLVTTAHAGQRNVMSAAWVMPLDFDPPKIAVVIDKGTTTRRLLEASQTFALGVPCVAQAAQVTAAGNEHLDDLPAGSDKFLRHGLETFPAQMVDAPLVAGCLAWLECRMLDEAGVRLRHDLVLAEVVAAQADDRVFANGRWLPVADPALRSLHHIAGPRYFATGEPFDAPAR